VWLLNYHSQQRMNCATCIAHEDAIGGVVRTARWAAGWRLPGNGTAHNTLMLRKVPQRETEALLQPVRRFIPSVRSQRGAGRTLSALLQHEPRLRAFPCLPYVAVASARAFPNHATYGFEMALRFMATVAGSGWLNEGFAAPDALPLLDATLRQRCPTLWTHLNDLGCDALQYLWQPLQTLFVPCLQDGDWMSVFDAVMTAVDGDQIFYRLSVANVIVRQAALRKCVNAAQAMSVMMQPEAAAAAIFNKLPSLRGVVVGLPQLLELPLDSAYYPALVMSVAPVAVSVAGAAELLALLEADEEVLRRRDRNDHMSAVATTSSERWSKGIAGSTPKPPRPPHSDEDGPAPPPPREPEPEPEDSSDVHRSTVASTALRTPATVRGQSIAAATPVAAGVVGYVEETHDTRTSPQRVAAVHRTPYSDTSSVRRWVPGSTSRSFSRASATVSDSGSSMTHLPTPARSDTTSL
jgi:hypothetical protein